MAGIPLKSGADFYNLEASRMRLHNLGADPTEFGLGQIYYNSSSGNNTSGRARLYTGNGFRSLAFMDDIAAIQEQLDLLTGEVDTSELISNLEDVLNFLNNIKENDGDLMTMLNGKLDKAGGTISGSLQIGNDDNISTVQLQTVRRGHFASFQNTVTEMILSFGEISAVEKMLAMGDSGLRYSADGGSTYNDILTSAGGTIKGDIQARNFVFGTYGDVAWGKLVIDDSVNNRIYYIDKAGAYNTLLHSGNIGEYALKLDGSNKMTGRLNMNDYAIQWDINNTFQLLTPYKANNYNLSYYNGSTWKSFAFTDSEVDITFANEKGVAGTTKEGEKYRMLYLSNANNLLLGYHTSLAGLDTKINGKNIYLNYGINHATGLILNSSGNVLIGTTTDDGTSAKLQVNGSATITAIGDNTEILRFRTDRAWAFYQVGSGAGASLQLRALSSGKSFSIGRDDGSKVFSVNTAASGAAVTSDASIFPLSSDTHRLGAFDSRWSWLYAVNGNFSGSVTIAGDLHVTGNIIADKEVSAGGAAEESGEGGGGTGGGVEPFYKTFTPSTTTVTINHNISSRNVIVQVYEQDSQITDVWHAVLVDIEIVNDTTVNLHFGRTETTEHKVVIIG